jgi:predicted transcriptional regulator
MKIFYDSNNNNTVKAIYSTDTNSTVWGVFDFIETEDPAIISKLYENGISCRLVISKGLVIDVISTVVESIARSDLRLDISQTYDRWVEEGVPVDGLSWTPDTLIVMPRDIELLAGVLSIASSKLARGLITDTAVVLQLYRFGDGNVKEAIIEKDLEELSERYQYIRSTRYIAHLNVKNAIDAGQMPEQADYELIGLTASDFDGLNLV